MRSQIKAVVTAVFLLLAIVQIPTASAVVSPTTNLAACVTAINDPLYTADTIAGFMGYANGAALQTAITNGIINLYVANGAGIIAVGDGARQSSPDLYCGDSNNNSVTNLDSSSTTLDYFFGGAGDDSADNSWYSKFYGGLGNDSVGGLSERSYFSGGPGNDFVTTLFGDSTFDGGDGVDYVTTNYGGTFNAGSQDGTAPTITSSSSYSAAENQTAVGTATANEAVTWAILSGVDSTTVNLVSGTGVISFKVAPNYEVPTDTGANNVYNLTIRATDTSGNTTDQAITITVTDVSETSSFNSFALAGSVTTATYRNAIAITADVTVAAKITFKVNGVVIPGCKNKSATGSSSNFVATCSWKPARHGDLTISALAIPTNNAFSNSSASPINVRVINRTGNRA